MKILGFYSFILNVTITARSNCQHSFSSCRHPMGTSKDQIAEQGKETARIIIWHTYEVNLLQKKISWGCCVSKPCYNSQVQQRRKTTTELIPCRDYELIIFYSQAPYMPSIYCGISFHRLNLFCESLCCNTFPTLKDVSKLFVVFPSTKKGTLLKTFEFFY